MKTIKEMIEVMKAYDDGKEIQYSNGLGKEPYWFDIEMPHWDWGSFDYRIKPEPKKRPMTFEEIVAYWKEHRTEIFTVNGASNCTEQGFITRVSYDDECINVCNYNFSTLDFHHYVTKEDGTGFEIEE